MKTVADGNLNLEYQLSSIQIDDLALYWKHGVKINLLHVSLDDNILLFTPGPILYFTSKTKAFYR